MSPETTELLNKLLTIAFPVSVITAVFANLFNKFANDKNQSLKYITDERAKWRNFVKESASKIYSREYKDDSKKALISKLILSLNPLSVEGEIDHTIVLLLNKIEEGEDDENTFPQLRYCIGMLLKHDWERSKNETRGILGRVCNWKKKRNVINEFRKWYEKQNNKKPIFNEKKEILIDEKYN
ncbi:hypothetical protein A8L34_05035 [Bacillus sp. FJAT-27264]|uniref:hypothetical protein n=1 Tax=Paenibacillus sp. (strain DSM 101736 / FJAT-27264) TaxID=1850362 RepID=UPI000807F9EC|nr:hypothetical protein [Bacillus sp. FJAT-27264]OBZ18916.1 hypothetical protein A8L34_05035 [Bacillus sp. FJAT-27264]